MSHTDGAFLFHREAFAKDLWTRIPEFRLFMFIAGNARWQRDPYVIGGVTVSRGQFLRSMRKLQDDLQYVENNAVKYYSLSHIKKLIDKLILDDRITTTVTDMGMLFTVVNYDKYQWGPRTQREHLKPAAKGGSTTKKREAENGARTIVNKEEKEKQSLWFDDAWEKYPAPRRKGKQQAKKHFMARVKTEEDFSQFMQAMENYLASVEQNKTETRYIKQASTFFNQWEEWVDDDSGESLSVVNGSPIEALY